MAKRVFGVSSPEFATVVPSGSNGLKPGHEWSTSIDTGWTTILDPNGRAHSVSLAVLDTVNDKGVPNFVDRNGKRRRVHPATPEGRMRSLAVATFHEKMVQAAPPPRVPRWDVTVRYGASGGNRYNLGPCDLEYSQDDNTVTVYAGSGAVVFHCVTLRNLYSRHIAFSAVLLVGDDDLRWADITAAMLPG